MHQPKTSTPSHQQSLKHPASPTQVLALTPPGRLSILFQAASPTRPSHPQARAIKQAPPSPPPSSLPPQDPKPTNSPVDGATPRYLHLLLIPRTILSPLRVVFGLKSKSRLRSGSWRAHSPPLPIMSSPPRSRASPSSSSLQTQINTQNQTQTPAQSSYKIPLTLMSCNALPTQ